MEKKVKARSKGCAVIIPGFVTETLKLEKGDKVKAVIGKNESLRIGEKTKGVPFCYISFVAPTGFSSLQINLPKLWADHHRLGVGSMVDINLVGDGSFTIEAVK